MEAILSYPVKVAFAIAAFYLTFLLLFRQQKQFSFNRLYLNGSFLLSFFIPLITITITRTAPKQMVILTETGAEAGPALFNASPGFDLQQLLFWGYGIVAVLFFLLLLTGYLKAISIVSKSRETIIHGIRVCVTEKDIHPFTFFNKIVISSGSLTHPGLEMILNHEKVHAGGKHTFDILLSEILFLFQWFNPFAWLLKDAIKNNLEFLTDQKVTDGNNMQSYQMAMVSLADKRGVAPFLNALNGNNLKNRIIMMNKKTENGNKITRQLAVIPLLVILILGLSNKEFKAAPVAEPLKYFSEAIQLQQEMVLRDTLKDKNKVITVIGYPGSKASQDTIKRQSKKDGSKALTVTVIEGQKSLYGADDNTWKTGTDEIQVIGYGMKNDSVNKSGNKIIIRATGNSQGNQPLYILDGSEIKSIEGISPDMIESISVLKGESAIALYGEKGKSGVIIITSKKFQPEKRPLIVLDGKETSKKMSDIDPEGIQSVNIWKGEQATKLYGEKGNNGVIEITMKHKTGEKTFSGINTVQELRKQIASSIRYPVKAQESGQQAAVKIYAFINGGGEITQITESKPNEDFITTSEVVIVGYGAQSGQNISDGNLSLLNQEASLCLKNLPDLNIPEFKNKWVAFQFKFVLQ